MHPIRQWRKRRALALLRYTFRLRHTTPEDVVLATTKFAMLFSPATNPRVTKVLENAIEVVESNGKVKPQW